MYSKFSILLNRNNSLNCQAVQHLDPALAMHTQLHNVVKRFLNLQKYLYKFARKNSYNLDVLMS